MRKQDWLIIILCLLPVVIGIGWAVAYKSKAKSSKHHKPPVNVVWEHPDGIDLSHHNEAYDWNKVDVQFVYIRATQGAGIKDSKYNAHRRAVKMRKIPMGAYHFLVANRTAEEQFNFFASVVDTSHIQLRPMLDVEESPYWKAPQGFTNSDSHKLIRKWCDLCKQKYGKAPIIYTNETLYKKFSLNKGFDDCIWWVANYNGISNFEKNCRIPFTLHQYSDTKRVEGFQGTIDCNRFRTGKSVDDLML